MFATGASRGSGTGFGGHLRAGQSAGLAGWARRRRGLRSASKTSGRRARPRRGG